MDTTMEANESAETSATETREAAGSSGESTSAFQHVHPLDAPAGSDVGDEQAVATGKTRRTRGLGSTRHTTSAVLALLAVPAGYGFIDYAAPRALDFVGATGGSDRAPDRIVITLAAAAACFLVAGLAGRISALGPLLAALVWGAAPSAWILLDYPSYTQRLNDLPELWHQTGFGIASLGFAVFPVVTGLMLGGAVAGRWRRPAVTSPW